MKYKCPCLWLQVMRYLWSLFWLLLLWPIKSWSYINTKQLWQLEMVSTKDLWMGGVKELNAAWMVPLSPWRGTWEVVIKGDGEVDLYRCRSLEPACRSVSVSPCTWSQVVMHFCLERVGWGRGKELHTAVSFLSAWVDGMEACHSDAPVGSAWLDHVEACY